MSAPIFKNERTMASAGSGKTYALTNRFIALVLGGARPEEICALTFTRKAAGEFFENTITKLAKAAASEKEALALSQNLQKISTQLPNANTEIFLELLQKFLKSAPMLHMETIDAFASRYVKFFSAELGLGDEITVMDNYAQANAQNQSIAQTLSSVKTPDTFAKFSEAFRIANMGKESKSVLRDLTDFIDKAHEIYVSHPDLSLWGNPAAYGRKNLTRWDADSYAEILAALKSEFAKAEDKQEVKGYGYILNFFENARPKKIPRLSSKAINAVAAHIRETKSAQGCVIPASAGKSTFALSEKAASLIDALATMLVDGDITFACEGLKAVWIIMNLYEHVYAKNVRSKGFLSFADMPLAIASASFTREIIEYRFDSKFSHWLFDEFQDTSRLQWNIFANLIEEVILNSENQKSFYYVGDIKQSIYSWRGGDPKLFDEIKEKFGGGITDNPQIKTSWRSAPPVIDVVNKLFGTNKDLQTLTLHFGENAAQRWNAIWQDHDVAPPNQSMSGCVSVQAYEDDMPEAVYKFLRETKPLERGLTCAVLTRRNYTAEKIVEHIRKRSAEDNIKMRAAGELEVAIAADNMAIPALIAFANAAVHPTDTLSREYAMMTPLKEFAGENIQAAFEKFLKETEAFGFAKAFAEPATFLAKKAGDSFTQTRIRQFLEMSETFDAENERDCDAFTNFARKFKIREGAAKDTVQVMSVHKSKGLDFDVVILPELEKVSSPGGGLRIAKLNDGNIVEKPTVGIAMFDKNLSELRDEIEDENAFESLCLYYVAFTRAKKAMHIILKNRKTEVAANSKNFAALFADIFGTPDENVKIIAGSADYLNTGKIGKIEDARKSQIKTLPIAIPENVLGENLNSNPSFSNSFDAKILGNAIHSILEKLAEFDCDISAAKTAITHLYANDSTLLDEAEKLVENALKNPDVRKVFECENYWSEKSYSAIIDSELQNGRFDRVNFHPEENRAEIIDFKTHSDADNAAHQQQLMRYKRALQKICNIENVSLKILSVADAKIIDTVS